MNFIVFDVRLPWIYPLAVELGKLGCVVGVNLVTFRSSKSSITKPYPDSEFWVKQKIWRYSLSFRGKLSCISSPLIWRRCYALMQSMYRETGEWPYVINPYPAFLNFLRYAQPSRLIYLNYDDYFVGSYKAGQDVHAKEKELVEYSEIILCSSIYRAKMLKMHFPLKKDQIFHFPHGVSEAFIGRQQELDRQQLLSVCIVGTLSARYDWKVIYQVICRLPHITFSFWGDFERGKQVDNRQDWEKFQYKVLALSNVRHIQGVKYFETRNIYHKHAINWMPYKPDLLFVQSACPLKLMDGIASGRPVLSSNIPEAALYPEWVHIYNTAEEAAALILKLIHAGMDGQIKQKQQIEFAMQNTWSARCANLQKILSTISQPATDCC